MPFLIGMVVDRTSNTPIPDCRVTMEGIDTFTDHEGRFTFRTETTGWHTLKVRNLVFRPYSKRIEIGPGDNELIIKLDRVLPDKMY